MKVLADENIPGLAGLADTGISLCVMPGRAISAADVRDTDALLIRSVTRVDCGLIAGAARLRFVGTATSGYDHVDQPLLREKGIAFAHAPGSNANSVVEYVLAAIAETDDVLERLLAGGCVGIVGYGEIGRRLGRRLDALGISWVANDPWIAASSIPRAAPLERVLRSEVVTLHVELTDAEPYPSRHLLDVGALARLEAPSLLINASRGPVVDNAALRQRLNSTRPPTVILDVWEHEPVPDADLLERVRFGSAHIAGYSWDGKLLATRMLLDAMAQALDLPAIPVVAAPPPILHPGDSAAEGAALMRMLLATRYSLAEDDRLLREAMAATRAEADRARAFDALRRDYRRRRELAGSRIKDPGWTSAQRAQAAAMGLLLD